MDIGA